MSHDATLRSSGLFRDIDASTAERLTQQADLFQLEPNEVLFQQDDEATFMCVVLEGSLEAVDGSRPETTDRLGIIKPGEPVGEIALLLGGKRSAMVRAIEHTTVARFDSTDFSELVESSLALTAALETIIHERLKRNRISQAVQSLFGGLSIDALHYILEQLEFHQLERNEYLFRAGDPGDSLYLVVSGSLEVGTDDTDGPGQVVAHLQRGQPIGEMALLAGDARGASIRAGRHSELVSLSRSAFEKLSLQYPDILLGIARILEDRFRSVSGQSTAAATHCRSYVVLDAYNAGGDSIDLERMTRAIIEAMPGDVRATVVSPQTIARTFRRNATDAARLALESWIDEIEARHDVVFFLPDTTDSSWFELCMKRSDEVLLLADARNDPGGEESAGTAPASDLRNAPPISRLILLHDSDLEVPRFTARFLAARTAIAHYHVRDGSTADLARVARLLTGRGVGLALGGGGARGVAHVGVIRALSERGVPIDTVAGTSMGAIVAALYGAGYTTDRMLEQIHAMFVQLNPFNEYTLPRYSLLRGKKAELASLRTFGRHQIEDLWVPFVCTSSNISTQTLAVHRSGSLSKAILATTAIPGITVPVIYDGEIHVDGGVMNNLPGDLIRNESAYLISCDVSLLDYVSVSSRRYPSPWAGFMKHRSRLNATPISGESTPSTARVPGIGTILNASVSAGSRIAATQVRDMSDLALTPPVGDIGILDFKKFTEIEQRGYEYTMRMLDAAGETTPRYAPRQDR